MSALTCIYVHSHTHERKQTHTNTHTHTQTHSLTQQYTQTSLCVSLSRQDILIPIKYLEWVRDKPRSSVWRDSCISGDMPLHSRQLIFPDSLSKLESKSVGRLSVLFVLQCVAVCCSVLQCVAVCCSMLSVVCSLCLPRHARTILIPISLWEITCIRVTQHDSYFSADVTLAHHQLVSALTSFDAVTAWHRSWPWRQMAHVSLQRWLHPGHSVCNMYMQRCNRRLIWTEPLLFKHAYSSSFLAGVLALLLPLPSTREISRKRKREHEAEWIDSPSDK